MGKKFVAIATVATAVVVTVIIVALSIIAVPNGSGSRHETGSYPACRDRMKSDFARTGRVDEKVDECRRLSQDDLARIEMEVLTNG